MKKSFMSFKNDANLRVSGASMGEGLAFEVMI